MTDAPVCLIQPDIEINQPDPRTWPSVPLAHDLDSALAAINALRLLMQLLLNQLSRNNHPTGNGTGTSSKKPQNKLGKYSEVSRQYTTVRVTNPKDPSQYVDVKQIDSLTMQDNKTREQWTWKR